MKKLRLWTSGALAFMYIIALIILLYSEISVFGAILFMQDILQMFIMLALGILLAYVGGIMVVELTGVLLSIKEEIEDVYANR